MQIVSGKWPLHFVYVMVLKCETKGMIKVVLWFEFLCGELNLDITL